MSFKKVLVNRVFFLFSGVILFSLLGLTWLYLNQEKLIFFPESLAEDYKFDFQGEFKEQNIFLSSGEKINYLVFNPNSTKGFILYFHGNTGTLKEWGYTALEIVNKTGWGVWMMDFPGFGKSSNQLPKTEKVLIEMGRALYAEILKNESQIPIVFFGRSVGSGMASALAFEKTPQGIILETPYRSISKLGHERYPILPESFSRFDLNSEKLLPLIQKTPILILHGTHDSVIPFHHAETLSLQNPAAQFVVFHGGEHNDLDEYSHYWPSIQAFLSKIGN